MNMIGWSGYMTSSERMTYLADRDISNDSIRDAWMNFVMVSVLAWQAFGNFSSALCEL